MQTIMAHTLNLQAVVIAGEQIPAAEELLERAEEHLDHPPQAIDRRDEFSRQIEPVEARRRTLAHACSGSPRAV